MSKRQKEYPSASAMVEAEAPGWLKPWKPWHNVTKDPTPEQMAAWFGDVPVPENETAAAQKKLQKQLTQGELWPTP